MDLRDKLKIGIYWAASCGGCDVSILDLHERMLDLLDVADIVFWPAAIDVKYHDVRKMEDRYMDICLFNGGIRTSENEDMARLLREKSRVLVAYGSCAYEGCIPGLANLWNRDRIFQIVYRENETTPNPDGVIPRTECDVSGFKLELPEFKEVLRPLNAIVDVDYTIPGCPPSSDTVWNALQRLINDPPSRGTIFGSTKSLCEECPRKKSDKEIKEIYRITEKMPDPDTCFLDQGIICMGPATRGGCGSECIAANMPCTGCYGPPPNVEDQGAAMMTAIASIIPPEVSNEVLDKIVDPVGTFYKYSLPASILGQVLHRMRRSSDEDHH